jgi:hypothetical protein
VRPTIRLVDWIVTVFPRASRIFVLAASTDDEVKPSAVMSVTHQCIDNRTNCLFAMCIRLPNCHLVVVYT